jgi:hypothetical protein
MGTFNTGFGKDAILRDEQEILPLYLCTNDYITKNQTILKNQFIRTVQKLPESNFRLVGKSRPAFIGDMQEKLNKSHRRNNMMAYINQISSTNYPPKIVEKIVYVKYIPIWDEFKSWITKKYNKFFYKKEIELSDEEFLNYIKQNNDHLNI